MATLKVTNIKNESFAGDQLYLKSDGKIGIGTTSPQRTLHLSSNNTVFALTDTVASTDQKTKYILSDAGILAFGKLNDAYDTAAEFLRFDNDGDVGIGGNGTGNGLGVYLRRSSPTTTNFYEASDGTKTMITGVDSTLDYIKIGSLSAHRVGIVASNGEKLSVLTNGNVGIGTTSPSEKLHVEGNIRIGGSSTASTAGDDLVIEGSSDRGLSIISGTSSSANVYFGDSDDTDIGRIAYQQTDNKLQFYVNAGKCGLQILNTGATELLHNGSLSAVTTADDFDIYRRVRVHADRSSGMGGHLLAIGQWDGSNHRIEGDANRPVFITAYNAGGIKMGVSGANKVTVTGDGLTFNGDTAAANALDDYEEGTWSPTVTFGGGSTGMNLSGSSGYYVKIGRLVNVGGTIIFTDKGSSTGAAEVKSLPFTIGNNDGATSAEGGGVFTYFANMAVDRTAWYLRGSNNSTAADISYIRSGGHTAIEGATNTDFTATTTIRFIMTYQT